MEHIREIIGDSNLKKYEKLSSILKYVFVDICNIDQNKYYILGSFAIREHRPINDLDINLDYHEFLKLEAAVKIHFGHIEFYNGQIRWFFNLTEEYNKLTKTNENDFSIEAFQKSPEEGFPNNEFSLRHLISNDGLDIDLNGHYFFNLNTLLKWKTTMGREKDLSDIDLINSVVQKGGKKPIKKTSKKPAKKTSKKQIKKTSKKQISIAKN